MVIGESSGKRYLKMRVLNRKYWPYQLLISVDKVNAEDMIEWCETNIIKDRFRLYYINRSAVLAFRDEDTFLFFKLRWNYV